MTTGAEIAARLSERIEELGLTENGASTASGVDRGYIGQLRRQSPSRSPTVKSLVALCKYLGLRLSWVLEGQGERLSPDGATSATTEFSEPLYIGQLKDTDSIQVEVGLLRDLIAEALAEEGLDGDEALAYADGVLGLILKRRDETVVVRLAAVVRSAPGSQAPAPAAP